MAELTPSMFAARAVRERYAGRGRGGDAGRDEPRAARESRAHAAAAAPTRRRGLYGADHRGHALRAAYADGAPLARASLGCGIPTAVADLHHGETVLDLGSGAGADVLIAPSASRPAAARSGST